MDIFASHKLFGEDELLDGLTRAPYCRLHIQAYEGCTDKHYDSQ